MKGLKAKEARALRSCALGLTLLALASSASALDLQSSLDGSVRSTLSGFYDALGEGQTSGVSATLLRLNGRLFPSNSLALEGAYLLYPEIRPAALSQSAGASPAGPGAEYRIWDPARRLLPSSGDAVAGAALYHEIDRALVTFRMPFADLSVGRQAVAWGAARIVNPTDILVPYRLTALDTEYRKGVDAVRVRVPVGVMNEVDIGYVAGQDLRYEQSALYARPRLYVLKTDVSPLAMVFRENLLAGLSLSRAIGEASAWLDGAYVLFDYVSLSVGVDRNIAADLYGYLEYHFNGAGEADPGDYAALQGKIAYTEGNVYLLGRHYLGIGATWTAGPLLPLDALIMVNLTDFSVELSLSAEYNFQENVYVGGGVFLGLGPDPEIAGGVPVRYRSEFGAYPHIVYTQVKLYF